MSIQLGSAYGKVSIDASGVKAGVGTAIGSLQNLSAVGAQVGATLQSVGRAMTIGVTLPILAIGGASVKAASDLEETRNKVKVVFGDMSDSVLAWSKDSAKSFGMSKQQALEAAGTFGNLFTSMGLARNKSADMSEGLVQLAADLASFNNIDPTLVLEKLRSGLVGEVEPLRTLGINLTMDATKAKALEMGLAGANGEISQAALLQARYALMLEQSTNAQGDFARTSDGLANSSRILKAELQDALAMLGTNLLPLVLKVVTALNRMLESFNNMSPGMQKAVIAFGALAAAAGPIISVLGTIIGMVSGLASIGTALGGMGISFGAVATMAGTAGTAIVGFGATALAALAPIALLVGALAILPIAFATNFMGITDTVKKLGFIIENVFKEIAKRLPTILKQLWFIIQYYFKMMVNYIVNAFKGIDWGSIGRFMMQGLANGILGSISALVAAATKAGQAALAAIKKTLGIHSASVEFMKLGIFSGEGYQAGLTKAMDPNVIARTMAKPVQNMSSSNSSSNVFHLSSGLTLRDVDRLFDEKINRFAGKMTKAMA
jgi:hypothetical protein